MDERPYGDGSTPPRPRDAPPAWSPPDAGAPPPPPPPPPGPTGPVGFESDADGPPTPPPVRARRRRWIVAGVIAAVLLVVGVPVGLAVAGWSAFTSDDGDTGLASDAGEDPTTEGSPDDPDVDPDGPDPAPDEPGDPDDDASDPDDDASDPDGGPPDDGPAVRSLDPLDLDDLDGVDATYGQLLTDVDASEQVMMTFQDEIASVFTSSGTEPEDLMAQVQELAGDQRAELLEVRDRMEDEVEDDGAETVRERYVAHLDAWADYMAAVEENPQALAGEGDDAAFNLAINTSADAFARSLEEELPDDLDEDVRRFAEAILERGFSGTDAADV